MIYDVVIIGAGPCGLFAGLELAGKKKTCIIDAGVDIEDKICHLETDAKKCKYCRPLCHILGGFGGAQFFNGTKLSRFPAGTGLVDFCNDIDELNGYYDYIDETLMSFGNKSRQFPPTEKIELLKNAFKQHNITMKYYNAQKVSEQTMNKIASNIKKSLIENDVDIFLEETLLSVEKQSEGFKLNTANNSYFAKNVILAVGRIGSRRLIKIADSLGIKYEHEKNEIEIGVRVEADYHVFDSVNNIHNDIKLKRQLNDKEELRTFCLDYKGFITKCVYNLHGDKIISSLDGHLKGTDEDGGLLSNVVNLAVHHRFTVDYDINEIYSTIGNIRKNGKSIVQTMKGFLKNTESDPYFKNELSMPDVEYGNINLYLPKRSLELIQAFIMDIDSVLPGFADDYNTVYAPSFEMGWKKFNIDNNMQSNIKGIYIGGDAAGHFRGAMQSMISGVIIAKNILQGG